MQKDTNSLVKQLPLPVPLFDTLDNINTVKFPDTIKAKYAKDEFEATRKFLKKYSNNPSTFNSYRREVERLLQWSWLVAKKSILKLKKADIEAYFLFCKKPPLAWIGAAKVARFINAGKNKRTPNLNWRPYVATVSKAEQKSGKSPNARHYKLSNKAFTEIYTVLNSFYRFMIQSELTAINPLLQMSEKSDYFKKPAVQEIKRLTERQWNTVIETVRHLADIEPERHERTLFIMSLLYLMYLRISELAEYNGQTPMMHDFYLDEDKNWWFNVNGPDDKERQIAVSDSMLEALQRWRKHLKLTPLPLMPEALPLLPKDKGEGGITTANQIRHIVQLCFDQAVDRLKADGFDEDSAMLQDATVYWLRHTGIAEDVKRRPLAHVREDAGHKSNATTDRYFESNLKDRHASAKQKPIDLKPTAKDKT